MKIGTFICDMYTKNTGEFQYLKKIQSFYIIVQTNIILTIIFGFSLVVIVLL